MISYALHKGGNIFMYDTQQIADRIKMRLKERHIQVKDMLSDLNIPFFCSILYGFSNLFRGVH